MAVSGGSGWSRRYGGVFVGEVSVTFESGFRAQVWWLMLVSSRMKGRARVLFGLGMEVARTGSQLVV